MQIKPEDTNPVLNEERLLVAKVQSGDFEALELLYERYSRQAFGLALKILNATEAAEDAVQDAFLRFWKQPGSFDPARGRFATWLMSVVHNLCIDQIRRRRSTVVSLDREESQEQVANVIDDSTPVEEEVWLGMQRNIIQSVLSRLPAEQRAVIELAYFKGMTHQEIAEQTGQPLGTIKSRIRHGLLKLRDLVKSAGLTD
jgi:RNA polymerase sigma-70 factor, ECF subfamily